MVWCSHQQPKSRNAYLSRAKAVKLSEHQHADFVPLMRWCATSNTADVRTWYRPRDGIAADGDCHQPWKREQRRWQRSRQHRVVARNHHAASETTNTIVVERAGLTRLAMERGTHARALIAEKSNNVPRRKLLARFRWVSFASRDIDDGRVPSRRLLDTSQCCDDGTKEKKRQGIYVEGRRK